MITDVYPLWNASWKGRFGLSSVGCVHVLLDVWKSFRDLVNSCDVSITIVGPSKCIVSIATSSGFSIVPWSFNGAPRKATARGKIGAIKQRANKKELKSFFA